MFQANKRRYIVEQLPLEQLFALLTDSGRRPLELRELCFVSQEQKFQRYLSFRSVAELRAKLAKKAWFLRELHIGAEYPVPCSLHSVLPLEPRARELVFDIDITDYAELRSCDCGAAKRVCQRCWGFLVAAMRFLDARLRGEFGFRLLLWEFSGRRGLHCWVFDAEARLCSEKERRRLLAALTDSPPPTEELVASTLEPELTRALGNGALEFRSAAVQHALSEALLRALPSADEAVQRFDQRPKYSELPAEVRRTLAWQLLRPRLDRRVTEQLNHLTRLPCSWHPETGNVCVPLEPARAHEFALNALPNLRTGEYLDRLREFFQPLFTLVQQHESEQQQQQQ